MSEQMEWKVVDAGETERCFVYGYPPDLNAPIVRVTFESPDAKARAESFARGQRQAERRKGVRHRNPRRRVWE